MSVTCEEKPDSRQIRTGDRPSATFHYILKGTSSETIARGVAETTAPGYYGGLTRQSVNIDPQPDSIDTVTDAGIWDVTAEYAAPEYIIPQVGDWSYAFETGGGMKHTTSSYKRTAYGPGGDPAPPVGGIGDDGENVAGVDIYVPVFKFSETHQLPDAVVTAEYIGTLCRLSGTTNIAKFRSFERGECLFQYASGSKQANDRWAITFHFAGSPNQAAVPGIPGFEGTNIGKPGWDYLWVRYQKEYHDSAPPCEVQKPVGVYVDQVYHERDFSQLGIGT